MKTSKPIILFLFISLFFSCEDNKDNEVVDPSGIDLAQSLVGTWLVDSMATKVVMVPAEDITILDPNTPGTGSINLSGDVNASLNYLTRMTRYSNDYSADTYDYFKVSNYPLNDTSWAMDRVDLRVSQSSSSLAIETFNDYFSNFINEFYYDFNTSSFSVGVNHAIDPTDNTIMSWSSDSYTYDAWFTFYLESPTQIILELTVDDWPSEASYNLYSESSYEYYFQANQEFEFANETKYHSISLGSGYHYVTVYDTYGDGGIQGAVRTPASEGITITGSIAAATESVSAGESKDIYDGGESSIQTMTFNSDGTVIISYSEDQIEDDELDLWYINDNSELVIIDGDYYDGESSNIVLILTLNQVGNKKVMTSSMEWCEYLELEESQCNEEYLSLENELLLNNGAIESIQQVLEIKLTPLGSNSVAYDGR